METKKEFRTFNITQYEQEQEYLRENHKKGWKFVKVTGIGTYHFEKCEPEDVVYQLDYNQEGIAHKEEYVQMFQDCGWEYLMDFLGYSYFRKPAAEMCGDEEIFCDDASRLEMMERIFKGRMLPLLSLFFLILLPQFIMSFTVYKIPALSVFYAIPIILYVSIFGWFSMKYKQYKEKLGK